MTWATDFVFVAGGDFVTENWQAFQHQTGIRAVVVLSATLVAALAEPTPHATLWLPVNEETDYTLDHLHLGAHFIRAAVARKGRVLLHAPAGVHRTRPLVAAYLLLQGRALADVVQEIEQRPWLPPYKGNMDLLKQFAASLTVE